MTTIALRLTLRRGTAANLAAVNEVPLAGELVVETDTGKAKLGNGTTAWNSLPYWSAGGAIVLTGTGSPAGVVSAPVGSLYTRSDGGAGSTLYVKESGTGSSGWVAK
ncbi:hypothetical protein [Novosphingobium olei]|uniref:hyaluronate lyase N-terminal domain-containing protein n=1 Tax=Novosphingobium olei TaxID=2728851 RepID=UPI003093BED3|nr:hypothetical protein NSDW_32880 [Novosphingobium olei]